MSESSDKRKLRHESLKRKMAADPELAAKYREANRAAKKRYETKKKQAAFSRETSGKIGSGKPGRIVDLCGWSGW